VNTPGTLIDITAVPIPEPASYLLSAAALLGMAAWRRKQA
jgi:hypothetical protein